MGAAMRYFVHVKLDKKILREDKEGFSDLYLASGRAAELASELIRKYPSDFGKEPNAKLLAVDVLDCDGNLTIRLPINPAYQ
jgi:hypothetical protein